MLQKQWKAKEADKLAQEGSAAALVRSEPASGLTRGVISIHLKEWKCREFLNCWRNLP